MPMILSHTIEYKYIQVQKYNIRLLMNIKWNIQIYILEKFTGLHHSLFFTLQEASDHVNFQIPTQYS